MVEATPKRRWMGGFLRVHNLSVKINHLELLSLVSHESVCVSLLNDAYDGELDHLELAQRWVMF